MCRIQPLRVSKQRSRPFSSGAAFLQRATRDTTAQHVRSSRVVVTPQPQPTVANEDGARTLRTRKHGNESLPLPPLMDPIAITAKARYKQPKLDPQEQGPLTLLQKEMQLNFYARALADPVRQCCITKARLPSHFLLSFTSTVSQPSPSPRPDSDKIRDPKPQLALVPSFVPADESPTDSNAGTSYVLNSQYMMEHLKKKTWTTLVSPRMQEKYSALVSKKAKKEANWTWDPQMQDRVLEDLRKHAIWTISYGLQRKRIVPIENLAEYSNHPPAAILEIGYPTESQTSSEEPPIDTYRMIELLGEDIETSLLTEAGITATTSQLAVLRHHRNFKLLFALDKLHLYVRRRDLPVKSKSRGRGR